MARSRNDDTDDDSPEMTAADFKRARLMREVMPEVVEVFKRGPGRPKVPAPKERVSLRLDPKIVAAYKSVGPGWQKRISDVLARSAPRIRAKHGSARTK
jgi:uncharacterized protein (DUF4415 family)